MYTKKSIFCPIIRITKKVKLSKVQELILVFLFAPRQGLSSIEFCRWEQELPRIDRMRAFSMYGQIGFKFAQIVLGLNVLRNHTYDKREDS